MLAASPRANPPRPDATKAPAGLLPARNRRLRTSPTGEGARPHAAGAAAPAKARGKAIIPLPPTGVQDIFSDLTPSTPTPPALCTTRAHGNCSWQPSSPPSPPTFG